MAIQKTSNNHHSNVTLYTCDQCQTTAAKMMRCGSCQTVFYCNQSCQYRAWPTHRSVCIQAPPPPLQSTGELIELVGQVTSLALDTNSTAQLNLQQEEVAGNRKVQKKGPKKIFDDNMKSARQIIGDILSHAERFEKGELKGRLVEKLVSKRFFSNFETTLADYITSIAQMDTTAAETISNELLDAEGKVVEFLLREISEKNEEAFEAAEGILRDQKNTKAMLKWYTAINNQLNES
jgi:hypothetical protein